MGRARIEPSRWSGIGIRFEVVDASNRKRHTLVSFARVRASVCSSHV